MFFREKKLSDEFYRWEPIDLAKPRHLTPPEKIVLEKKDEFLTEKAETRAEICWCVACLYPARVWVREVCFDFKGDKAEPVQHAAVSSADYPGPVPGFCMSHLASGPVQLAEAVYWDRPEMAMGVKPDRWFVVFTDGMRTGGDCRVLDPLQKPPKIEEIFYSGS